MSDQDLIDKIAELWVENGGDMKGFWFSVRKIADSIDEIEDKQTREIDRRQCEADLQAGVRSRKDGWG